MSTEYDKLMHRPWTIEYRHRTSKKKILFMIPPDEDPGNGLELLQSVLGNKDEYFNPRAVNLMSELLRANCELTLVCPNLWFMEMMENVTDLESPGALYRVCSAQDLENLAGVMRTRYSNIGLDPLVF